MLEPAMGVINICLPVMRPAILVLMGKKVLPSPQGVSTHHNDFNRQERSCNFQNKNSAFLASRRKMHGNLEDMAITAVDWLDDEYPLATRIERRSDYGAYNLGEITVERRGEVRQNYECSKTLETKEVLGDKVNDLRI